MDFMFLKTPFWIFKKMKDFFLHYLFTLKCYDTWMCDGKNL
jgi:hypothetical protein